MQAAPKLRVQTMDELWRSLNVGDEVRVVTWPNEMLEDRLHEETRELYRWLINTQTLLTIVKIDEWGLPFGKTCRNIGGVEYSEYLALNHSGLEVVGRRKY
jgi:hypothetical protein